VRLMGHGVLPACWSMSWCHTCVCSLRACSLTRPLPCIHGNRKIRHVGTEQNEQVPSHNKYKYATNMISTPTECVQGVAEYALQICVASRQQQQSLCPIKESEFLINESRLIKAAREQRSSSTSRAQLVTAVPPPIPTRVGAPPCPDQ
jgi:hypothetical protein